MVFSPEEKKDPRTKNLGNPVLHDLVISKTVVCADVVYGMKNHTPVVTGKSANASQVCSTRSHVLTLRVLMSYIYGAPSKARNANVVYIWTYVWQR